MKNTFTLSAYSAAAAVFALTLSSASFAHDGGDVVDSSGKPVFNSAGDCVIDSSFTEANRTVECGAEPPKPPAPAPAPKAAPAPAPAPAAPAPVAPTIESVSINGEALFALDSARLSDAGKSSLDGVVDQLRGFDKVRSISITGHTDSTGSEAYNQKLSEKRAKSVLDYLASRGVNPSLLNASGAGELAPVADNGTRAGRAQNRRVDIDIDGSKIVGQ